MANRGGANLPLARVKTIMKSSPEVETVTQESLFLITRATVGYEFDYLLKCFRKMQNILLWRTSLCKLWTCFLMYDRKLTVI